MVIVLFDGIYLFLVDMVFCDILKDEIWCDFDCVFLELFV